MPAPTPTPTDATWTVHVHADVLTWLSAPDHAATRGKIEWALLELGLRGRTSRVKGTVKQPWRRTPVAGNAWYLTWALGGTSGISLGGQREVWVRAVREHDATGRLLDEGSPADYAACDLSQLDPRTSEQSAAIPTGRGVVVRQVAGPPGAGKTLTLLFATRAPKQRALYLTTSDALARSARMFFDATAAGEQVRVFTVRELVRHILGLRTSEAADGRSSFYAAAAGTLRPLLGPWQQREAALWAELRGVACGLPQPFAFRRGDVEIASKSPLDRDAYAALSELPDAAIDAVLAVARVAERDRWIPDLADARAAAARLSDDGLPAALAGIEIVSVDEAQDLTPVELGLVVEVGRAIANAGGAPRVYLAGDDSQTLLPSGFDWGIVGDLAYQRLGAHVARVDLTTQMRQPGRHAALVASAAQLYRSLSRDQRPHVARPAASDDAAGRVIVVDGDPPADLVDLLAELPGRALVTLTPDAVVDPRSFTPESIKGLEREFVVVTGLPACVARIASLAQEAAEGDPISGREARRGIDRIRVALSRSTDTLVVWGPGAEGALRSLAPDVRVDAMSTEAAVRALRDGGDDNRAWAFLDEARELFDRGDAARGQAALDRAVREGAGDESLATEAARVAAESSAPARIVVRAGDSATLVAAFERIASGGIVELEGGTFEVPGIVVTRDVRLVGAKGASIGSSTANVLFDVVSGSLRITSVDLRLSGEPRADGAVVRSRGGDVHLDRCKIDGPVVPALVALHGGSGSITACGLRDAGGVGVRVTDAATPTIDSCSFARVPTGVHVSIGAKPVVRKCVFTAPTRGVEIVDAGGTYEKNKFIGAARAAIAISGDASDALIESNEIDGGQLGVRVENGAAARVLGNRIRATKMAAVDVGSRSNVTAARNVLADIEEIAVRVEEQGVGVFEDDKVTGGAIAYTVATSGRLTLRRGRIEGCSAVGVQVLKSATGVVEDCRIERAGISGMQCMGERAELTVRRTKVRSSKRTAVSVHGGRATIEDCSFSSNGDAELAAEIGSSVVVRDSVLEGVPSTGMGIAALTGSNVIVERCRVRGDRGAIIGGEKSRVDVIGSKLQSAKFAVHLTGGSSATCRATEMAVSREITHWVEPGCALDVLPGKNADTGGLRR